MAKYDKVADPRSTWHIDGAVAFTIELALLTRHCMGRATCSLVRGGKSAVYASNVCLSFVTYCEGSALEAYSEVFTETLVYGGTST